MAKGMLVALLFLYLLPSATPTIIEIQALLQFKSGMNDPLNHLKTWNFDQSPCDFLGVGCDSNTGKVIGISLSGKNLSGSISPLICNISSLSSLDLGDNSIYGNLPSDLAACTNLKVLNLSLNSFMGYLPDLSCLVNLQVLDLSANGFTGKFPVWIGELKDLVSLSLAINEFDEGEIPGTIGNLKNLTTLYLAACNFVGEIPISVFSLTMLETLDFSANQLSGDFPKEISNLQSIRKIELYQNSFTGELPHEISNLENLQEFDISHNQISGKIPEEFGNLKNLTLIQLFRNNFLGELPGGLGELKFLKYISIYENNFSGEFPQDIGRYSPLTSIDISENNFSGPFPKFLCQNKNLQDLLALDNNFSGEFPDTYADCKTLERFRISNNQFTGNLPEGIWGLPAAVIIDLSYNSFTGEISSQIGNSVSLNQLCIQSNKFSGDFPSGFGKLSQLQKLYASNNKFSGKLLSEFGNLSQLTSLHLEGNELTGQVPSELSKCSKLVDIDLSRNLLSGDIPEDLCMLSSLNSLNLSYNFLTGSIPEGLQSLKLSSIDFSRNKLTGLVPNGLLVMAGENAFMGNLGLCIDRRPRDMYNADLGICMADHSNKNRFEKRLLIVSVILSAVIILLAGLVFVNYRSLKMEQSHKTGTDFEDGISTTLDWKLETFYPIELVAEDILNLKEENLIGSGSSSKVYRLDLKNNGSVAVKKFQMGKNFSRVVKSEMDILGKIRHRNILKLYACLTSDIINFLVFEYMPKGNLFQALRRETKEGVPELDWNQRYKIALGSAKGLMYLHHDCLPAIVHRDIKSTNILLDQDYEAKIADFGIAKFAEESDMSCFEGTHGYIAPELAYSLKVTEKSDVYSFGVVLFELVTGRGPIDPEYGEGKDLVDWVSSNLHGSKLTDILDRRISGCVENEMMKFLKIARLCTTTLPTLRPTMREVVNMLSDPCACSLGSRRKFNGNN